MGSDHLADFLVGSGWNVRERDRETGIVAVGFVFALLTPITGKCIQTQGGYYNCIQSTEGETTFNERSLPHCFRNEQCYVNESTDTHSDTNLFKLDRYM